MKRYTHKRGRYKDAATLLELDNPSDVAALMTERDSSLRDVIDRAARDAEKALARPWKQAPAITSIPEGGELSDDETRHFAIEVRDAARRLRRALDSGNAEPAKVAGLALNLGYRWAQLVTNWHDRAERDKGRAKLSELRQARRDWLADWLKKRGWSVESLFVSGRDAEAKLRRESALKSFRNRFGSDASAAKFDRARGDLRDSI